MELKPTPTLKLGYNKQESIRDFDHIKILDSNPHKNGKEEASRVQSDLRTIHEEGSFIDLGPTAVTTSKESMRKRRRLQVKESYDTTKMEDPTNDDEMAVKYVEIISMNGDQPSQLNDVFQDDKINAMNVDVDDLLEIRVRPGKNRMTELLSPLPDEQPIPNLA